jgi:hypothetical protein
VTAWNVKTWKLMAARADVPRAPVRSGLGAIRGLTFSGGKSLSVPIESERGSISCFDAFSSCEPVSTPHQVRGRLSLENALGEGRASAPTGGASQDLYPQSVRRRMAVAP